MGSSHLVIERNVTKKEKDIMKNNDVKCATKTFGNIHAKAAIHFIPFSTGFDIGKFESGKDNKVFATMGLGTRRADCCKKGNNEKRQFAVV